MPNYNLNTYLSTTHRLSNFAKRDIFGIPYIEKQDFDISEIGNNYSLIKYNNCTRKTKLLNCKIGHGFMYDDQLDGYLKNQLIFICEWGNWLHGPRLTLVLT